MQLQKRDGSMSTASSGTRRNYYVKQSIEAIMTIAQNCYIDDNGGD
jgi:hypothetical protein